MRAGPCEWALPAATAAAESSSRRTVPGRRRSDRCRSGPIGRASAGAQDTGGNASGSCTASSWRGSSDIGRGADGGVPFSRIRTAQSLALSRPKGCARDGRGQLTLGCNADVPKRSPQPKTPWAFACAESAAHGDNATDPQPFIVMSSVLRFNGNSVPLLSYTAKEGDSPRKFTPLWGQSRAAWCFRSRIGARRSGADSRDRPPGSPCRRAQSRRRAGGPPGRR